MKEQSKKMYSQNNVYKANSAHYYHFVHQLNKIALCIYKDTEYKTLRTS